MGLPFYTTFQLDQSGGEVWHPQNTELYEF